MTTDLEAERVEQAVGAIEARRRGGDAVSAVVFVNAIEDMVRIETALRMAGYDCCVLEEPAITPARTGPSGETHSDKARRAAHVRFHVNRDRPSRSCSLCQEAAA